MKIMSSTYKLGVFWAVKEMADNDMSFDITP